MYTIAHYYHLIIFLFHISALIFTGKIINYHGDELHTNSTHAAQLKSIIILPGDVISNGALAKNSLSCQNMPQDGERMEFKLLIHLKYWCMSEEPVVSGTANFRYLFLLNTSLCIRPSE